MKPILFLFTALSLICATPLARAAFGVTNSGGFYTVDSGAGLVFKVDQANGNVTSIKYNNVEYQDLDYADSHLISGLGSDLTVSATTIGGQYVKVAVQTSPTNGVVANLTHYFMVKNGDNTIYMATYAADQPGIGELRWITRLEPTVLPTGPEPSDTRGKSATIESADVFAMPDGTTRSKYYGDTIWHSKDRAMDMTYCGTAGPYAGVWMVYGSRESSSGGPFFRDIQEDCFDTVRGLYNYMFSGHNQTENMRLGVLHGPYALVFNGGEQPALPLDLSWIGIMGLTGYVPDSGRGAVEGTVSGIKDGYEKVVGFKNATAQYWTVADASGNYTSPLMKPGSYTVTLYQDEFEVDTDSVTVSDGNTNTVNLASAEPHPTYLWKIGDWDGSPAGLMNSDKVIEMHPSDVRMDDWDAAPVGSPFVVGTDDPRTRFPCYEWKDVGSIYIQFNLTTAQKNAGANLRIGITAAYSGGRPAVYVNGNYINLPGSTSQPSSRSLTIGTYRGNNAMFDDDYTISSSDLVVGTNILRIKVESGTAGSNWLSPGYSIDCVEWDGPAPTAAPSAPSAVDAAWHGEQIALSWKAEPSATHYILERATAVGGPYTTLSSDVGPARYVDTSVTSGTLYYYRVKAVNPAGTSSTSTPASALPDTPTGLNAATVSSDRIDLSWAAAAGAESYNIKRAAVSGGPYTTITNLATLSYSDIGLDGNTTYYYVVSAVNTAGEGDDSQQAFGTTYAEGVLNFATDAGTDTTSTISGFNMNGGNALVILVSGEGSTSYSATYNGTPVTAKVATSEGGQSATVFYVVNPSSSNGDVVVSFGASTVYAVSVLSLNNVSGLGDSATFGEPAGTGSWDLSYSGMAGGIVVAAFADNSWQNVALAITGDNIDTYLQQIAGGGSESAGRAHAYGNIPADGTYTNTFTWGDTDSSRNAGVVVAFEPAPLAAPSGLTAMTVSSDQINLNWSVSAGATSYTVKRSAVTGGPFTGIASGIITTNYADIGLSEGSTYHYVVSAVNAYSASVNSSEASATTLFSTPPDIGVSIVGGTLSLSWPSNYLGWTLQYRTNLLTGSWQDLSGSDTNFTYEILLNELPANSMFYKLVLP